MVSRSQLPAADARFHAGRYLPGGPAPRAISYQYVHKTYCNILARPLPCRCPAIAGPTGLIRLSVGVEPVADLITDIDEALQTLEVP